MMTATLELTADAIEPEFPGMSDDELSAATPGAKTGDPHAPYGYTADGQPRSKPGRKPGASGTKPPTGPTPRKSAGPTTTPPAPPKKRTTGGAPKPPSKAAQTDYRPGIVALLGEVAGAMALGGVMRGSMPLIADAATIDQHAPGVADLANTAAARFPVVAAILDKVLTGAPLVGGGMSLVLLMGQIAVNHGAVPAGLVPGTVAPDALVQNYMARKAADDEAFRAAMDAAFQAANTMRAPAAESA